MKVISRVVFRADQSTSDYGGDNSQNWHGEDSYRLGESYNGLPIVNIELAERWNMNWVEIFVREQETIKLVCSIPIHAVNRMYFEDL